MTVTYLCHSGFLVETQDCCYLFDYYRGELPALPPEKPVLVCCSHRHGDHYNPVIFKMLQEQQLSRIYAVLSGDIPKNARPKGLESMIVEPDREYILPQRQHLTTLRSTDEGVAFLIADREGTIYYGGDLNNWIWEGESGEYNREMTRSYRRAVDSLEGTRIDLAFLPLDPRQEEDYASGMLYFLQKLAPRMVFPMHYWGTPRIIDRFLKEYPEYAGTIQHTEEYKNMGGIL